MPKSQIALFASVLRTRYVNHEISADDYASAMEDLKLCGHGRLVSMASRLI